MKYHFIWYLCLFIIVTIARIRCLQINVNYIVPQLRVTASNSDLANSKRFYIYISGSGCYQSDQFVILSPTSMTYEWIDVASCNRLNIHTMERYTDGVTLSFNVILPAVSTFNLRINEGQIASQNFVTLPASGPVTNLNTSSTFPSAPLTVTWTPSILSGVIITRYIVYVNSSVNPCLVWSTINCTDCGSLNTINTTGTSITPACINIASEGTFTTKSASISMTMTSPLIQPYTEYFVFVAPINTFGWGTVSLTTVRTVLFNPSSPRDFTCVSTAFNQLSCSWNVPNITNGPLNRYNLICSNNTIIYNATLPSTQLSANVSDNVMPGTNYTCMIQACNSLYCSQFTTFSVQVNVTLPPSPLPIFTNNIAMADVMSRPSVRSTSTQIYIILPYSYVTENREPITNFSLAIAVSGKSITSNSTNSLDKTYTECDRGNKCTYVIILPYPVVSPRSKRDTSTNVTSKWQNVNFTIGDGSSCFGSSSCNGPLTPSSQYIIGFRACAGVVCNTVIITKSTTINLAMAIAVPLVVMLVVILIITISTIYIVRSKRRDTTVAKQPVNDVISCTLPAIIDPYDEYDETANKESYSKARKQLVELVKIREELERREKLLFVDGHEAKNRYRNIRPYQHNAIRLTGPDHYINASKVCPTHCTIDTTSQCCCTNYYIAAQGPIGPNTEGLCSTIGDFWRMIMENDVRVIINLTRCVENDQEECAQYWPDNVQQSETYLSGEHKICVTLEKFSAYKTFTERILSVAMDGKSASIIQLHYTTWNNDDIPNIQDFLRFYDRFDQARPSEGPMVVHCSAGVGRTGTWTLIDIELRRINDGSNNIDIYNTLLYLMQCRCAMVHSEKQYVFVLDVIDEYRSVKGYMSMRKTQRSHGKNIRASNAYSNEAYE